jgi:hypothetical protein
MTRRIRTLATAFAVSAIVARLAVRAEVDPPPAPSPQPASDTAAAAADEQKKEIERQQALIDAQKKRIESQQGDIDALKQQLADMEQTLLSLKRRLDELEAAQTGQPAKPPPPKDAATAAKEEADAQAQQEPQTPEIPPDVVSAGDFPGSIRIPGTDAAVRFGALIRTAFVFTLAPLGSDTSFITNSIPVGPPPPGDGPRTAFTANTSRFNMDFRTPTGIGQIRAFIEGDFTGSGNTFYLRQAYAQYKGFIMGQTWSTFSDPEAAPEDIDFEGVSSKNEVRQPQLRYTWATNDTTRVAVSGETPSVDISGGQGVNIIPDVVARAIWRPKAQAHIQLAGVLTQLRAQPTNNAGVTKSAGAYGISVSAAWPFVRWKLVDRFVFQVTGGVGIARYIKDLNDNAVGEDGAFNPATGSLEALPVLGTYLAYQHMWREWEYTRKMNLRSNIIASWVWVDNPSFQPPDSYKRTQRYAGNLVFSPSPRIDVGVQYIWGQRVNLDGQSGWSDQIQLVGFFKF